MKSYLKTKKINRANARERELHKVPNRDLEERVGHKMNALVTKYRCEIISYTKTCPDSMFSFSRLQAVST